MDSQIALGAFVVATAYVVALTLRQVMARLVLAFGVGAALGPWGLGLVDIAAQPLWRPALLVIATPLVVALGATLRPARVDVTVVSLAAAVIGSLALLGSVAGVPVVTVALAVPVLLSLAPRDTAAPGRLESRVRWVSATALALGGLAVTVMHAPRWLAAARVTAEGILLPAALIAVLSLAAAILQRRGDGRRDELRPGATPLLLLVLTIAAIADLVGAAGMATAMLAGWWLAAHTPTVGDTLEPLLEGCALVAAAALGASLAGAGASTLVAAALLGLVTRAVAGAVWALANADASATDQLRLLTAPPAAAVALGAVGVATFAPLAPRATAAAAAAVAAAAIVPEALLVLVTRTRPVLRVQIGSVDRIGDRTVLVPTLWRRP